MLTCLCFLAFGQKQEQKIATDATLFNFSSDLNANHPFRNPLVPQVDNLAKLPKENSKTFTINFNESAAKNSIAADAVALKPEKVFRFGKWKLPTKCSFLNEI